MFQLFHLDLSNDMYELIKKMIYNMSNINKYKKNKNFDKAKEMFLRFRYPPAIEFGKNTEYITPDIVIYEEDDELKIRLNEEYYPEINIEHIESLEQDAFVKPKIREALDLIDALSMRQATLYKVGLMIIEYQYDFLKGGDVKPMKLQDIADSLDRNTSTISRAMSNKYISTPRGTYSIKSFLSNAIDNKYSSTMLKDFIQNVVKEEKINEILSDEMITKKIQDELGITIGRRTVAKYREHIGIATSADRKRVGGNGR
jgi:RNA polymerase sigma-54 factor